MPGKDSRLWASIQTGCGSIPQSGARRLIAAIPVGPAEPLEFIRAEVDALFVLTVPEPFFAVADHYLGFAQLEDKEVLRYLEAAEAALHPQHPNWES